MLLRRWHRWVALPAALFLIFICVTGLTLHWELARNPTPPPGGASPAMPLPDKATVGAMVARVMDEARREPGLDVSTVSLTFAPGGRVIGTASAGPSPLAKRVEIDALTGARFPQKPDPFAFRFLLLNLHSGLLFGWFGATVSILCGLSLLILSVTGLQIWFDAYRRRKNRKLFWK